MDKLKMETHDRIQSNIDKLATLFPTCVTEARGEDGKLKKTVNFELLKQMLSDVVLEGDEAYEFTWVGKKAAIVEANRPIRKTLRPCPGESVNWDSTENLYIEGDNLDVLKLLQESYLGKVKVIYIDPPYNTGSDFIFRDDFSMSGKQYKEESGQMDENGKRLFKNTDSNGRFHSDWCSMIYSRLLIARDMLADDGVIFISIDDNEQSNLVQICNEIFGSSNAIGPIIQNKKNAKNDTMNIQRNHEFILVYRKRCNTNNGSVVPNLTRRITTYHDIFTDEDGNFYYLNDPITTRGEGGTLNARPNLGYTVYYNPETKDRVAINDYDVEKAKIYNSVEQIYTTNTSMIEKGYVAIRPPKVRGKLGCWTWALEKFNDQKREIIITGKPGAFSVRKRTFVDAADVVLNGKKLQYAASTIANSRSILEFSTNDGTGVLNSLLEQSGIFSNPKNEEMLEYLFQLVNDKQCIIMDFFSGSATTAHAVMQMNVQDGGRRKFIMVQLPEPCDEKSEAYKAGYPNICEIGKERIRRAAKKIAVDTPGKPFDSGFRVFKLDDTNMTDVYYTVEEYTQDLLSRLESNIKPDRTGLDLLFGCLLEWGLPLSMPCTSEQIQGCNVYTYNGDDLIACFDEHIPEDVINEIAKRQPLRVVFRDSSFADSPTKINMGEIFKVLAPDTRVKVL
jgi:adenine-specific DNA-methyltransferase